MKKYTLKNGLLRKVALPNPMNLASLGGSIGSFISFEGDSFHYIRKKKDRRLSVIPDIDSICKICYNIDKTSAWTYREVFIRNFLMGYYNEMLIEKYGEKANPLLHSLPVIVRSEGENFSIGLTSDSIGGSIVEKTNDAITAMAPDFGQDPRIYQVSLLTTAEMSSLPIQDASMRNWVHLCDRPKFEADFDKISNRAYSRKRYVPYSEAPEFWRMYGEVAIPGLDLLHFYVFEKYDLKETYAVSFNERGFIIYNSSDKIVVWGTYVRFPKLNVLLPTKDSN